jgi:hypothetical protein
MTGAGIVLIQLFADLGDLAAAEQGRRARLVDRHDQALADPKVDRAGKAHGLFQPGFVRPGRRNHAIVRTGGWRRIAALLEDRNDDDGTHVIPGLFVLRDDRFVFRVSGGYGFNPVTKRSLRFRTSASAVPA